MGDGDASMSPQDFDSAIKLAGFGKVQYEVISVCAITILATGFQNGLSAYVFPAAQCDLNLTSAQIGLLNVVFLIGGTCSAFFWGVLADLKGRRKILIITLLFDFAVTVVSSLMQSFFGLLICRFANGFLIGAPGSITFSYLAEFQPPKFRSKSVCYSGLFFTMSWLMLPVIAKIILPLNFELTLGSFHVSNSWRLFLLILSLPELLAGLWLIRLPESPKFFVARGNGTKALAILQYMFSANLGKDTNEFPVKKLIIASVITENVEKNSVRKGKIVRILKDVYDQIKRLFQPPLVFLTFLTCTIMFTNMFGFFGLGLWLPELFTRFERYQLHNPNKTATVKELAILTFTNETINCTPTFDGKVFRNTVSIGVASMIGNLLSGFAAGKLPLKFLPLSTMLLGGLSAATICLLQSSMQNLIVSCIFQSTMATANVAIGSVAVELFPTAVNAMAICMIMCAGRIGAICSNMTFGFLMDKHCEIPIYLVSGIVIVGAILCFFLPTRSDKENGCPKTTTNNVEVSVIENCR